jgi:asparagine synthase (glutamine-hydrolysing)
MPGIVGIIGIGEPDRKGDTLRQMVKCMMHEPSYTSGTYVNESLGLWLGWVSHGGSFSDCMPAWNETGDVCLIFSGEDFRDSAEITGLKVRGHEVDPENASYIVHLYEEMGLHFVEKLNGCFSGVLVDLRKKRAVVFNDRYGLGRIYYHENAHGLYFCSEAKALLKVLPDVRRLDLACLAETFSCGCVLQNRTLFRGISLLPGGTMCVANGPGVISKDRYFDYRNWENQSILNGEVYYERLRETFSRILPRYFSGRRKVGMSLTGGLDGRMIMAWAKRAPGDLPCHTFGSSYRDCTDVRIARRVAQVCRQPHETIVVDTEFLKDFPKWVEKSVYVSDGTMDATGAVEFYVNQIAREIAPVRMTGNYGSEIVRENIAFRPIPGHEEGLNPEFAGLVRDAQKTYQDEFQSCRLTFIAFKQVPWHHYSRLSVEQSQLTTRSPFLDNEIVSLMYQAPPDLAVSKVPALRLIADGNAELSKIPTDRGLLYEPIPVYTKCRHLYEEFTFKAEYAYDYGMPQWVAEIDHILSPLHLERLFLGRHKFHHFRVWYRDKLGQYLKDILLDTGTLRRPYLDGGRIEEMVNGHIKGERNYTSEIHRIITSELIQRQLIEQA